MSTFSPTLFREQRARQGLTREQLAVAAGRSHSLVAQVERGVIQPGAGSLGALARALQCEVGDLFAPDAADAVLSDK